MIINPADLQPRDAYRLLISVVVPRPIGWVSTMGADGSLNLAPFSFFNAVGHDIVMISIGQRKGAAKDTLRNVQETGEFVVNIVSEDLAEAMNLTSGEYDYTVNEFDLAKLQTADSIQVKPPRVAASPVSLEAKVTQIVPVEGTHDTMILGRVVCFHVRDDLLRPDGRVDAKLLKPVGRLSGDEYAKLGDIFKLTRPRV